MTHPRRVRPDRDDRCRSATRPASRSSPARWAGRCPGYPIALVDPATGERGDEGEICLDLRRPPARPDGRLPRRRRAQRRGDARTATTTPATSARRDADGYITYVGRTDDVFKASDYRISPVRAGERADRARRRSPRRPSCRRPTRCGWPCRRPTSCWPPGYEPTRETARSILALRPRAPRAVQADPAAGVRRAAEDDLRARSAGSSCAPARSRTRPAAGRKATSRSCARSGAWRVALGGADRGRLADAGAR